MTKYKAYFTKMLEENKIAFAVFKKLHNDYSLSPNRLQGEFNEKGQKILEIVREYENRLCANTERGIYNKFSASLSEKFQNEVRREFPMIDHVGLKVEGATKDGPFVIKKISLS